MTEIPESPVATDPPPGEVGRQLLQVLSVLSQSLDQIVSGLAREQALIKQILLTQTSYQGKGTALTFDDRFNKIFVDTRVHDLAPHVLLGGHWENPFRALFENLIQPGDVVFDVGANIGIYTLAAAQRTGSSGRVHAFEPNVRLASLVAKSIAVNGYLAFAQVHALALSNEEGQALLHLPEEESCLATLRSGALPVEALVTLPCTTRRADAMFGDNFSVDVVKMDVEGFEGCVVQGMVEILRRSPNVRMLMEWYVPMMDGSPVNARQTADLLRDLRFFPWECLADGTLLATQWERLIQSGPPSHYIMVARSDPSPLQS